MTEAEDRMTRLEIGGIWLVNENEVHISSVESLARALLPGQHIVMVSDVDTAVRFIPSQLDDMPLGCIAGWISED